MTKQTALEVILGARAEPVPTFHDTTYEDHVSAARAMKRNLEQYLWALASVSASIETKYGEQTVQRFARDADISADYVRKMALTYRAWENGTRVPSLSFKHYRIAVRSKNPQKAIETAEAEGMSTRQLEAYIRAEKKEGTDQEEVERINCPHCNGTGWTAKGEEE